MSLRSSAARVLERGALPPVLTCGPSRLYAYLAQTRVARPLRLPKGTLVIGIGGAVLGGAGKTPVAIAYAHALSRLGARVALISHGYGTKPRSAALVHPEQPVSIVGDDALVAASSLQNVGIPVWAGSSRQQVVDVAASTADVLVIDGLLQTAPEPLARSVLVLDEMQPWGSGACPPAGDLRAPAHWLWRVCDEVVWVRDPLRAAPSKRCGPGLRRPHRQALVQIDGVRTDEGICIQTAEVRGLRVGLLLTVARPNRVLASLQVRGLNPLCCWFGTDHRGLSWLEGREVRDLARRHNLDLWLVTSKCRPHLSPRQCGAPLATVVVSTWLDPAPRTVLDSDHA
jgi:tetraacyldisaccharide 4'-kinase